MSAYDRGFKAPARSANVIGVQDDLVTLQWSAPAGGFMKNEIVLVSPRHAPDLRLKAEVLRIRGDTAEAQVYESTRGLSVGDPAEPTGAQLSAELGPGLLGQVFDGLQNPLEALAVQCGVFLPRGVSVPALPDSKWPFTASVSAGASVLPGDAVGWVEEGRIRHAIKAPYGLAGPGRILWIEEGAFAVSEVLGEIEDANGRRHPLRLAQTWPVRRPLGAHLERLQRVRRVLPDEPIVTTQRVIDSFFPIAKGGTACIPGPFGAGKTILQNLIARFSDADVVVVVACGERAGEVVEMMQEFARLKDREGKGALMERTVIICNTSAMPVASREASIHMGATIAEHYRQMGLDVLLIADSTSRWAQALREIAGRLEEIPGEEAYPAYLATEIKSFYERAGVVELADGSRGSLTIVGTVSPAGGNFDEPVTQATLSTVKCFLGLSSERAYKRFYPAIDPLESWSRYRTQLAEAFAHELGADWNARIARAYALLRRGAEVEQMLQVSGDDGVSLDDYIAHQKAMFLDAVFLQQDAFDAVDAACPLERQAETFARVETCLNADIALQDREVVRAWFSRLTAIVRALNLDAPGTPEQARGLERFRSVLAEGVAG